jgi:sporulation integral membrane protein YlbJ
LAQIIKTILFSVLTLCIAISLVKFPDQSLEASIRGLNIWWEVVFPSLLPFFITAELLISFGVVRFIGVLFEPIMRPLFNVPGVGSFGMFMGMASGYPTGAKIATRLREEKQLTRVEAERLVSFTNASSPLFIFAAISVGFFHDNKLGALLAVCHYVGNLFVGLCMRFYRRSEYEWKIEKKKKTPSKTSLRRAFYAMHRARISDERPLGEILGDAVIHSVKTLVMVGGFIVLFSVLTKLMFLIGFTSVIAELVEQLLLVFSISTEFGLPIISGLFEITIGVQSISGVNDTLLVQAILVSFILGFNGFSVQAQVASIISKTDIRFAPYFFARILHGFFASTLTIFLYKPLYLDRQAFDMYDIPVVHTTSENIWMDILTTIASIGPFITIICIITSFVLLYRRFIK